MFVRRDGRCRAGREAALIVRSMAGRSRLYFFSYLFCSCGVVSDSRACLGGGCRLSVCAGARLDRKWKTFQCQPCRGKKKKKTHKTNKPKKKTCSKLQTEHPRDCGRLVRGGRAGHASPLGGSSRPPGGMRGYGDIGIQGYGDAGIWGRGVRGPLAGAAAGDESAFRASP